MTNSDKILAFTTAQKFILLSSTALLLYGTKSEAAQNRACSLINSLVNQKKLRRALTKYKKPSIYILPTNKSKRKSPRDHDRIVNECAARSAFNSQFNRKEQSIYAMDFPTLDGHCDFYKPRHDIFCEFHYGTMVYEGVRQIKDKLQKYRKDAVICWIVSADHADPSPEQEFTASLKLFEYTQRFVKDYPDYHLQHYFIPLSRYLAGKKRAWTHPDCKGRRLFI